MEMRLLNCSEEEFIITKIYSLDNGYLLSEVIYKNDPSKDPLRIIMEKVDKGVVVRYRLKTTPEFFKFIYGFIKNQVRKSLIV
jgi:hypothetical protein